MISIVDSVEYFYSFFDPGYIPCKMKQIESYREQTMKSTIKAEYRTQRMERSIPVKNFLKDFVDIPRFLKLCEECHNYNQVWSCPEYDFDPLDIWNQYKTLDLVVVKVLYDEKAWGISYTNEEIFSIVKSSLLKEKEDLLEEYLEEEKMQAQSLFLSAGSCDVCGQGSEGACSKPDGKPCRYPDKMRYSVESLGGDVVKAAKTLFDLELKWSDGKRLPEYYMLMCGLLKA